MTLFSRTTSPSRPRWDGTRVFFEIADGNEQIQCAISRAALEEISEKRCFRTADLLGVSQTHVDGSRGSPWRSCGQGPTVSQGE